ncbi:MAG: hypothetical protein MJ252_20815 [archaeon]|nr:hypothetical protein [archaeon]
MSKKGGSIFVRINDLFFNKLFFFLIGYILLLLFCSYNRKKRYNCT